MLVKDFMRQSPVSVKGDVACSELISRMTAQAASCAIVTDPSGRPLGIVTEQDITRRIAFRVAPDTPAEEVMTDPIATIAADAYLYQAIGRMRKWGLRHMPVVDRQGALAGLLDLYDAMAVASSRMMGQIDSLTHEGSLEGLRKIKGAQVDLASEMFADNLPAPEIQALLTQINNGIYRRVVDARLRDMSTEGWGVPPVAFTVIVFGSGGRGENFLFPDQDFGFILGDYPDDEHHRIDAFFIELAERVSRDLNEVGFPYCKGFCMAVNPLWRKTLPQWLSQIRLWSKKHHSAAIRLSDIFFDFQPAWGDLEMAEELRRKVTKIVGGNLFFLELMFKDKADDNVALGLFGGFITEQNKEEYKGQLSLKFTGTLPLVSAIRILALREGVKETSTLSRIKALHEKGVLEAGEQEELTSAFSRVTGILLRQQIKDFKAGRRVSYYVDPKPFSKRARAQLTESLKAIDSLRKWVRTEFTGEVF